MNMHHTFSFLDMTTYKAYTVEQLKPYMYVDFTHFYTDFTDPSNSKETKIKIKECTDSDFDRTDYIRNVWGQLDYFKPYYCFDNVEDMFLTGTHSTYDTPRGYVTMDFRECKKDDHCEKDIVKRRNFLHNVKINIYSFEEQIDFKNHKTEPIFSYR